MMKLKTLWLLLPLVAAGCNGRDGKVAEKELQLRPVCTLEENLTLLGMPFSMDMAPDGSFVVTDLTLIAERNGDFYALEEGPGGAYRLVTLK